MKYIWNYIRLKSLNHSSLRFSMCVPPSFRIRGYPNSPPLIEKRTTLIVETSVTQTNANLLRGPTWLTFAKRKNQRGSKRYFEFWTKYWVRRYTEIRSDLASKKNVAFFRRRQGQRVAVRRPSHEARPCFGTPEHATDRSQLAGTETIPNQGSRALII